VTRVFQILANRGRIRGVAERGDQGRTSPLSIVLIGAPRTKKNHGKVIKRGGRKFHVSSDAYEAWNASVQMQLAMARAKESDLPFRGHVNVRAFFYRHADVGDAVGFYQGLADALQEGRILENDRQIRSWNGSLLLTDAANPRTVVTIEVLS
jgi:Holliday junction resolvase RusA-like endonuclease